MNKKANIPVFISLLTSFVVLFVINSFTLGFFEKIEGIVAVINEEIITVTDLRIVKAFDLYDLYTHSEGKSSYRSVLENMVNQKLVHQFTGGDVNIEEKHITQFLSDLKKRFKKPEWEERLNDLGMGLTDLRKYCEEYLLYKEIISDRFRRSVVVSLEDIEEYYNQVYVPEQKAKGEPIKQMVDILPEIESAVKEKNTRAQAEEWIATLRNSAEIQIRLNKYRDFLKEMENEK